MKEDDGHEDVWFFFPIQAKTSNEPQLKKIRSMKDCVRLTINTYLHLTEVTEIKGIFRIKMSSFLKSIFFLMLLDFLTNDK